MDEIQLTEYLHAHIPLSAAMQVTVRRADAKGVTLEAPLAPNINHRETVFGGSASAVAILAAWTLLYLRLRDAGLGSRVVIQHNTMRYEKPITGTFTAVAATPPAEQWERFVKTVERRGRARIAVTSELRCEEERVGFMEGDFVALNIVTAVPPPAAPSDGEKPGW